MTLFEQIENLASEFNGDGELRIGQSYMLALFHYSPHLYKVVSENDELDCFYLDRNIERYEDFQKLVSEFGETKTRNTGKSNEYLNVKEEGAAKGVNLKDYVFLKSIIEKWGIERQQEIIDELKKYRDKYLEYKNKYESLLVFGVITNNEKLKRKN